MSGLFGKGPWANFAPEPVSQETLPPRGKFVPNERQAIMLNHLDGVIAQADADLTLLRAQKTGEVGCHVGRSPSL